MTKAVDSESKAVTYDSEHYRLKFWKLIVYLRQCELDADVRHRDTSQEEKPFQKGFHHGTAAMAGRALVWVHQNVEGLEREARQQVGRECTNPVRELAKLGYEAFAKQHQWISPETGHDLGEFDDMEPKDKYAWEVAIWAVIVASDNVLNSCRGK